MLFMAVAPEKRSDHEKIEEIVRIYGSLMFYVANRILNHEQDAEDAVQQALLSIYQNISKISALECPQSKSFIVTVVERKAIDLYRVKRRRAVVSLEEELDYHSAPCQIEAMVERTALAQAMAQLPAKYRSLLLLKYDNGYSEGEIAQICGMTRANVRKTLQRARQKLETIVTERGDTR